jgi:hypothetical protein
MGDFEDKLQEGYRVKEQSQTGVSALDVQVGGSHYKDMRIQPAEFILANDIGWGEGCAIAYLSRWRSKGGIDDLRKARHTIDLIIEQELSSHSSSP